MSIVKPTIEAAKKQIAQAKQIIILAAGRRLQFTNEQYTKINTVVDTLVNGGTVNGKTLQNLIDENEMWSTNRFLDYLIDIASKNIAIQQDIQNKGGRRKHRTRRNRKQRKQRKHRTRKH